MPRFRARRPRACRAGSDAARNCVITFFGLISAALVAARLHRRGPRTPPGRRPGRDGAPRPAPWRRSHGSGRADGRRRRPRHGAPRLRRRPCSLAHRVRCIGTQLAEPDEVRVRVEDHDRGATSLRAVARGSCRARTSCRTRIGRTGTYDGRRRRRRVPARSPAAARTTRRAAALFAVVSAPAKRRRRRVPATHTSASWKGPGGPSRTRPSIRAVPAAVSSTVVTCPRRAPDACSSTA